MIQVPVCFGRSAAQAVDGHWWDSTERVPNRALVKRRAFDITRGIGGTPGPVGGSAAAYRGLNRVVQAREMAQRIFGFVEASRQHRAHTLADRLVTAL